MLRTPCQAADKGYASDKRKHGAVRAKVEHVFRVLKCQFGYRKVRYRGLAKNQAQMFSLMALANLYMARLRLRAESV